MARYQKLIRLPNSTSLYIMMQVLCSVVEIQKPLKEGGEIESAYGGLSLLVFFRVRQFGDKTAIWWSVYLLTGALFYGLYK